MVHPDGRKGVDDGGVLQHDHAVFLIGADVGALSRVKDPLAAVGQDAVGRAGGHIAHLLVIMAVEGDHGALGEGLLPEHQPRAVADHPDLRSGGLVDACFLFVKGKKSAEHGFDLLGLKGDWIAYSL